MTKWILVAGLVAFATAAQAQYYGGSSYSYDNSSSYGGGYSSYQTYGGNNDPSPHYYSAPTYTRTYRTYSYRPRSYYSGYSSGYRSGY